MHKLLGHPTCTAPSPDALVSRSPPLMVARLFLHWVRRAFQVVKGLEVDGEVGSETRRALKRRP